MSSNRSNMPSETAEYTGRKLLRPRARTSYQGYKRMKEKMNMYSIKEETKSSDSDLDTTEDWSPPPTFIKPEVPGCTEDATSICYDHIQTYQITNRHQINKNCKRNPELIAIAQVTKYKELEIRWDFDGKHHRKMKAYGIYYITIPGGGKKKKKDLTFKKTDWRQLGVVGALPLPMEIKIVFDPHPKWSGDIYFAVRFEDEKGKLGRFSKPIKCIFKPHASDLKVVNCNLSVFDLSGPDPLTDVDGAPFFSIS